MLWRTDPTGRHQRRSACVLLLLAMGACSTLQSAGPPLADHHLPRYVALSAKLAPVALVLSGGSARGYAHLGVLRVLSQRTPLLC